MDPLIRSRLREELRDVAVTHHWGDLLRQHGTPLLILDPARAATQYRLLQAHLPEVDLHYAIKSMPHPAVINAVAACGGSFDVASAGEVDHVRSPGISMSRCIYTHPVKKPRDIDHAYQAGIRRFVVDNPGEAHKFRGRPPDIEILVRLAFANPGAKSDLSVKFGVDVSEAEQLVKDVLATGVRFIGFSFHVGSQSASIQPFRTALAATSDVIDQVEAAVGVRVQVLDIGGGFPVTYRDPMPSIAEVGAVVREILGTRTRRLRILAEPGRFIAAACGTLLTSVVGTAIRNGATWHYLDDGLYGSYSNVLTEDVHPPLLALAEIAGSATVAEPVVLAGPTCDSVDVIARDYPMPVLRVGDVVVSPMMGAYTTVTASGFNGITPTPVVVV
ncbi:MAG: diaminopimelate decarboxylase [Gordonia sp.]|nr:diaminopimelate decarboxylase [Gordonia sp. (in: high G+C Gram-positive bacteria)]